MTRSRGGCFDASFPQRIEIAPDRRKAEAVHLRGVLDFAWLDEIVDYAVANGLNVLLETGYGNPAYGEGGGGRLLGADFPSSDEVWVDLMTGRVYEFPQKNIKPTGRADCAIYKMVPVYDSPCLLTERAVVLP